MRNIHLFRIEIDYQFYTTCIICRIEIFEKIRDIKLIYIFEMLYEEKFRLFSRY